jgi:uncharacterized UPF0160 family protein
LSSAGLIYAHYGESVIAQILGLETKQEDPKLIKKLYERLYKTFVESVDAIDNGIQQFDGAARYVRVLRYFRWHFFHLFQSIKYCSLLFLHGIYKKSL